MKRSVKHYRDHEIVLEVDCVDAGWRYTIHVLGHDGDTDVLRREECSAERFASDIDALHAADVRARQLVDSLADDAASTGS